MFKKKGIWKQWIDHNSPVQTLQLQACKWLLCCSVQQLSSATWGAQFPSAPCLQTQALLKTFSSNEQKWKVKMQAILNPKTIANFTNMMVEHTSRGRLVKSVSNYTEWSLVCFWDSVTWIWPELNAFACGGIHHWEPEKPLSSILGEFHTAGRC